uniref:MSP domain-containing protein n=1 Tax=Rhabditophanes sp. KR3021 TaxID=114890 RepID=A0AC35TH37_9BILA
MVFSVNSKLSSAYMFIPPTTKRRDKKFMVKNLSRSEYDISEIRSTDPPLTPNWDSLRRNNIVSGPNNDLNLALYEDQNATF